MNDTALLFALGIARPRACDALDAFRDLFPGVAARDGARRRLFDERTTAGLMLGQVLCRNAPCKDAVRRAQMELGLGASCSTAAFCKARARVRVSTLDAMSAALSAKADVLGGLDGFSGVHAVDVTTFQASDTEGNRSEWPYAPGQKPGCGFPVFSALMAHSLVGGGSETWVAAPWKAHDFRLFAEASQRFREGALYVCDRAFCSYAAFAMLGEAGAAGVIRGREWCLKRRDGDKVLGAGDRLTTWERRPCKRFRVVPEERWLDFPEKLTVRVITATIRARGFRDEKIVVVTSLLDSEKYPKEKILEWYLRRWEIEVSFRDMKTTLRYEFIRGRSPRTVRLEIAALLLAYNLMRYVMARGRVPGERRGVASTAAAVMAFVSAVPVLYAAGRSCARAFARLVAAVAADTLAKRRRKPYERAVKRRPKPYKLLTKPRSEYRQEVTA